ncbi:hypothetical protein MCEMSE18_00031 [Candidatus Planktophila versatilis]|uniref:hypothetical protein n=1 Tax=Candidatus Planktophila versatilis TaxID=1884905 RepID=UPI003BEEBAD6
MTQDRSREKSLLFLLSAVSRSLEIESENRERFRESIATLQIQDSGGEWDVSAEVSNEIRKHVEISKDRFVFYPVKSAARYEVNPAIINKNSAQEVLLDLFAEYGVQVPGKKSQPTQSKFSRFLPINLLWAGLFSVASIYSLQSVSFAILLGHLFVTTSKHYVSSLRRWSLIASIAVPALVFLAFNHPALDNLGVAYSQVGLLFIFDLVIRIESEEKSKLAEALPIIIALTSLTCLFVFQTDAKSLLTLMMVIVATGYLVLRQNIGKSLRSVLLLVHLSLFVCFIGASVIANPYRALLIPYLIYVALYETFLGDNRNPSKLAFGAVCLAI